MLSIWAPLLYGSQYFDKITYLLVPNENGHTLKLDVTDAPPGKLKLAAHYDSENRAGINMNFTVRNLFFNYSRALIEFDFAENPRLDLNYLKYIGKNFKSAVTAGIFFSNNLFPVFDLSGQTALFKNKFQQYLLI